MKGHQGTELEGLHKPGKRRTQSPESLATAVSQDVGLGIIVEQPRLQRCTHPGSSRSVPYLAGSLKLAARKLCNTKGDR